ncbi:sulfotransferase family protein [Jhaorihella thermophila]|uniref:Sulfotransferase domain-containing protein n=1 Tax=Jhaorihella thermophila TaxID=488547 RepID=A0A1H5SM60_9RHOB|nr:hypothetical protein [Jhaorihella thermophila]SEF51702.1 hypothetical protein SAMN05421751_101621 [Jhaorihella thermophila]
MSAAPRILCVGTHHKTGTVWMRRVWREIAQALDIPFQPVHRPEKWAEKLPAQGRVIVPNWGGRFAPDLWEREDARFLHVIRDPRDVLLSGARYHDSTSAPTEKWLYRPDPKLGGKSYQQYMRSLARPEDKLAFEMQGMHLKTLTEMLAWPYGHARAFDIRYEDLIVDTDCTLFSKALRFMGFDEDEVETGARIFYENSIFGGLADNPDEGRTRTHVKSGKPAQWVTNLPVETAELYLRRHGADLIALGYETDETWLGRLAPGSELAETGN